MSGEFVARMEDVLDLYQPEYNPERPVVCFDETSRQLTGEVRPPIEAAPGRVARYDTEYQRNGTRNLFMICEPKGGWRHVEVTERRTAVDFAHQMRWLVDEAYPDAEVVRLVLDNLNTHKLGSLYEAFEPTVAGLTNSTSAISRSRSPWSAWSSDSARFTVRTDVLPRWDTSLRRERSASVNSTLYLMAAMAGHFLTERSCPSMAAFLYSYKSTWQQY